VGASHSGTDIAYEVAATRPTTLVGRDCGEIPVRLESQRMKTVFPVLLFLWRHLLTRRTPVGRKEMGNIRLHGGPMLRVKRSDLAERGVVRNESRVTDVRDGLPVLADGTAVDVANVVWATGFRQDFGWIDLPAFGEDGWPREYRGVVDDVPGLFFCGLSFQYAFASMLLVGCGRDAEYIAHRVGSRASRPAQGPAERRDPEAA
jgi:putative flavoprotein involved in K+ transport